MLETITASSENDNPLLHGVRKRRRRNSRSGSDHAEEEEALGEEEDVGIDASLVCKDDDDAHDDAPAPDVGPVRKMMRKRSQYDLFHPCAYTANALVPIILHKDIDDSDDNNNNQTMTSSSSSSSDGLVVIRRNKWDVKAMKKLIEKYVVNSPTYAFVHKVLKLASEHRTHNQPLAAAKNSSMNV
jgi:hypothetical protein